MNWNPKPIGRISSLARNSRTLSILTGKAGGLARIKLHLTHGLYACQFVSYIAKIATPERLEANNSYNLKIPFARETIIRIRWMSRAWIFIILVVTLSIAIQISLFAYETASWRLDRFNTEFEVVCGRCHRADKAHRYAKAPVEWGRTVNNMLSDRFNKSKAYREAIASFLIAHRSANGDILFNFRCGKCHSHSVLEPYLALDPRALELLLQQHTMQHNYAIQVWEGELIIDKVLALQRERKIPRNPESAQYQVQFQNFCGLCHTTRFLYRTMCECEPQKTDEQWRELVMRMRMKSPRLLKSKSVFTLTDHIKSICKAGRSGL